MGKRLHIYMTIHIRNMNNQEELKNIGDLSGIEETTLKQRDRSGVVEGHDREWNLKHKTSEVKHFQRTAGPRWPCL